MGQAAAISALSADFRIRDLMHYTDPVSLYIITHADDKTRLKPLVRIVVNMIVRRLAHKMEFEKGRPKPTYKHKLLAMIDESPALGKLEILRESLAFVAGYGIKCYLISRGRRNCRFANYLAESAPPIKDMASLTWII
jgi:type IV secretion system protein VirD4